MAGFVKPGFEAVHDAFVENFDRRGELGAACCVYHRGEKVVDLWGGSAFGSPGTGGSFAFADPHAGVGYAYIPNQMGTRLQDPREVALRRATYRSIGEKDPHRG